MSLVPILIISLILLVITILLIIADTLLVSYGPCRITVHQEDQAKEFTVQGGGFLLSSLTDNGVPITSSCGGKATCGYCKVTVRSGGGHILPTEEIFMSRQEKLSGTRLACQVKVKEDMEIYIPDLLTTVRSIVENKSYDPRLRWRFIKTGQEHYLPAKKLAALPRKQKRQVLAVLEEFEDTPGAVVPALQQINETFNYLPEPILRLTAERLHIPLSEVHRLATFYNAFSLKPKGRNIIRVCNGTSCYVKGGRRILQTIQTRLGIKVGENTRDLKFSLETVTCIGCCGQSPVIAVNEDIYGYFRVSMIDEVLRRYS